jgi:hypothetical protein
MFHYIDILCLTFGSAPNTAEHSIRVLHERR